MRFIDFVAHPEFVRLTLTPAQRVLVRVGIDGDEPGSLEGEERELARRIFGPIEAVPPGARGVFLIKKGARIGGTYLAALYSLWRAFTADLSTLAPGERASALFVAPDLRLAGQALRYALGAAKDAPGIASRITSVTADSLVLRRGNGQTVAIECLPATRGGSALRGRSLVSAVLSEASFFRDESAVVNDQELFRACAPRVLPGGLVVIESTPWAESGLVYDLFTSNWGEPATCLAADAPTLLMRPDARTAAVVAREEARDPENSRREFGAEFLSGGSGLYFGAELGAAIDRELGIQTEPLAGARVTIGGDIGLTVDATAFCAVHRYGDQLQLADLLELRPRKGSPHKLSEVVKRGFEFAARHGQRTIHVDDYVLGASREHVPEGCRLERIAGGNPAKAERFRLVKEALRCGQLKIPGALIRVANQLGDVVSQPGSGGIVLIKQPRRAGSHGDAAAAAVVTCSKALEAQERVSVKHLVRGPRAGSYSGGF